MALPPHSRAYDEKREAAMPRSGPISLSLPAFEGTTRKLILANVVTFCAIILLRWLAPHTEELIRSHLLLEPRAVAHGELWQLFTYSFVDDSLLGVLFAMLTLWFTGSLLEPSFAGRWLGGPFAAPVLGGLPPAAPPPFPSLPSPAPAPTASPREHGRAASASWSPSP